MLVWQSGVSKVRYRMNYATFPSKHPYICISYEVHSIYISSNICFHAMKEAGNSKRELWNK